MHAVVACTSDPATLASQAATGVIDGRLLNIVSSAAVPPKERFIDTKSWARLASTFEELRWTCLARVIGAGCCKHFLAHDTVNALAERCIHSLRCSAGTALIPHILALGALMEAGADDLCAAASAACWQVLKENLPRARKEFIPLLEAVCDVVFGANAICTAGLGSMAGDLERRLGWLIEKSSTRAGMAAYALDRIAVHFSKRGLDRDGEWAIGHIIDCAVMARSDVHDSKPAVAVAKYCAIQWNAAPARRLGLADLSNERTRFTALQLVCSGTSTPTHLCATRTLDELLWRNDAVDTDVNGKYHHNSAVHSRKLRIWQVFIVLAPALAAEDCERMLNGVVKALRRDNLPSIRTLMEWVVYLLVQNVPVLLDSLFALLGAWDEHPTLVASALSVLSWICRTSGDDAVSGATSPSLPLSLILEHVVPWVASHHNGVRAHAHAVVQAAAAALRVFGMELSPTLAPTIDFVEHSVATSKGKDVSPPGFTWDIFCPRREWCAQFIFCELPRIIRLDPAERIAFSDVEVLQRQSPWICPLQWNLDPVGGAAPVVDAPVAPEDLATLPLAEIGRHIAMGPAKHDLQRKALPTAALGSEKLGRTTKDLVVIASLVDKAVNLGGLARTCEVLGASSLVVSSRKWVTDKEFLSVSASASKWIPIHVVPASGLGELLGILRHQGYSVVGAEQTINSVPLEKQAFTCRTALVLGAERSGIPSLLIPSLDCCVEIPQVGQIRSLNVHVTGALFVWEYVRQMAAAEDGTGLLLG